MTFSLPSTLCLLKLTNNWFSTCTQSDLISLSQHLKKKTTQSRFNWYHKTWLYAGHFFCLGHALWLFKEWMMRVNDVQLFRKQSNQIAWNVKITEWIYNGSYWIINTHVRRRRQEKTTVFWNVSTIEFAVLPVVQSLVSIASPSHGRPPPSGGGLLQKRTLVLFSLPQHFFVHLVQELQAPQLPWITENTVRKVHGLVHG